MTNEPSEEVAQRLAQNIGKIIDNWRRYHDDITIQELLRAIEIIRYKLTEELLH